MHHYPFHPGDYNLATQHWSEDRTLVEVEAGLLRDLAYRRLLDLYHGEEEPIPSKTRLVAIRIRMLRHEDIVTSVLKEKFTLRDGYWRQDRADEDIEKYRKKVAVARENGKKGGRPRQGDNQSGSNLKADGKLTNNHKPRTNGDAAAPPTPRGCRLPDDWTLPDDWRAFCVKERPDLDPNVTAGLFADHWHAKAGKDAVKLDWKATWRNWVRNQRVTPGMAAGAGKAAPEWHETRDGLEARAAELGIEPYDETTPFPAWAARVKRAAGLIKAPGVGLEELTGMAARRAANG